jgi:protoporphyrinogen oxidase
MAKLNEAIVVGGGLAGLITTYILSNQGYQVVLLEKSNSLGGLTGSFHDELGNHFDYGYHALDFNRSAFTTNFFKFVLDQEFNLIKLKRGLLLKGQLIPYNSPASYWPADLSRFFSKHEFIDDIGEKPNRSSLESVYGEKFTKFVFSEIIEAYPALRWKKKQGASDEILLENIYPWFFPQAEKKITRKTEWHRFHDSMRSHTNEQKVLYPSSGGFGKILDKIIEKTPANNLTVRQGLNEIRYEAEPDSKSLKKIIADGEEYSSNNIFWCATPAALCNVFGIKLPKMLGQDFFLGSYVFEEEFKTDYQEILAADPSIKANRISFTGSLANTKNNRVQLEYFAPEGEETWDDTEWNAHWQLSLKRCGLLNQSSNLRNFNFKKMKRGFLTLQNYDEIIQFCKDVLSNPGSNITIPFWGVGPENINRLVPSVFQNVYQKITQGTHEKI